MSHPKAYSPAQGYKFQILARNTAYGNAYDHCDYAKDSAEKNYLIGEYRLAYGAGWEFKTIRLPSAYWPKAESQMATV